MILVCFAVKEEARFFRPQTGSQEQVETLLTGIGRHNAEKSIRTLLGQQKPRLVLSCGFAGGLRPDLAAGSVLFSVEAETGLELAEALLMEARGLVDGVVLSIPDNSAVLLDRLLRATVGAARP